MNKIIVESLQVTERRIEVIFRSEGNVSRFFTSPQQTFFAEYSESIGDTPYGIAVIPFVANVLPICWLTDAVLEVQELDQDFYECIPEIKHGYIFMHRMLDFKGKISCPKITHFQPKTSTSRSAVLFSGGVDAFATLLAHIEEEPMLVTLHGADVKLSDTEGWEKVKSHVISTAENLSLASPVFIKTNFRNIIKETLLTSFVKKSKDNYWHGFQHGIGISSHVAPLAYQKGLTVTYMASSFTVEYKGPSASDPIIESHLRFCGSRIFHDRYAFTRQDKIRLIIRKSEENKQNINLHVCWESAGGENCCKCEKCIRTIYGILAENGNPLEFGFTGFTSVTPQSINNIERRYSINTASRPSWDGIKTRLSENPAHLSDPNCQWIYNLRVRKTIILKLKIRRILSSIYHKIF